MQYSFIEPGTDIITLCLGDVQEPVLTLEEGVELQRIALKNGNYFVLGPVTIATLKHALLCEQDERMIQRNL
jgi:hypothetical protein